MKNIILSFLVATHLSGLCIQPAAPELPTPHQCHLLASQLYEATSQLAAQDPEAPVEILITHLKTNPEIQEIVAQAQVVGISRWAIICQAHKIAYDKEGQEAVTTKALLSARNKDWRYWFETYKSYVIAAGTGTLICLCALYAKYHFGIRKPLAPSLGSTPVVTPTPSSPSTTPTPAVIPQPILSPNPQPTPALETPRRIKGEDTGTGVGLDFDPEYIPETPTASHTASVSSTPAPASTIPTPQPTFSAPPADMPPELDPRHDTRLNKKTHLPPDQAPKLLPTTAPASPDEDKPYELANDPTFVGGTILPQATTPGSAHSTELEVDPLEIGELITTTILNQPVSTTIIAPGTSTASTPPPAPTVTTPKTPVAPPVAPSITITPAGQPASSLADQLRNKKNDLKKVEQPTEKPKASPSQPLNTALADQVQNKNVTLAQSTNWTASEILDTPGLPSSSSRTSAATPPNPTTPGSKSTERKLPTPPTSQVKLSAKEQKQRDTKNKQAQERERKIRRDAEKAKQQKNLPKNPPASTPAASLTASTLVKGAATLKPSSAQTKSDKPQNTGNDSDMVAQLMAERRKALAEST